MTKLTYSFLLLLLLGSCTYPCAPSDGLTVNFISYSEQEIGTYSVKKFVKGGNFSTFVDSMVIDSTIGWYYRSNDTLHIGSFLSSAKLAVNFDYKIYIPAVNRTYEITEIFEPQLEGRKSTKKMMCGNSVQSCKINGVPAQIRFDNLYLKK